MGQSNVIAFGDLVYQLVIMILVILLFISISLLVLNYIIKRAKKSKQLDELVRERENESIK